jgi:glycosyltransferase involved in cell wall biosynthesis
MDRPEDKQPAASIIIPAFNASEFILATLDSISAQKTSSRLEVIVVNDGSTDSTREIVESYPGMQINCITIENSGGPSRPRNIAIAAATGRYIVIFDSDDLMLPGKIENSLRLLDHYPEAGFLFTNFQSVDSAGNILKADFLERYDTLYSLPYKDAKDSARIIQSEDLLHGLAVANFIGTSSVVIRRSVLDEVGNFDEQLRYGEDFHLWVRLANKHTAIFLDKVLHQYRIHENSISNANHSERLENLIALNSEYLSPEFPEFFREKSRKRIGRISYNLAKRYLKSGDYVKASKFGQLAIDSGHKIVNSKLILLASKLPLQIATTGIRLLKKVMQRR